MPEQRKQPGFVVAVLALLGLFSIPQVLKVQDGGSTRSTKEKELADSRDIDDGDDEPDETLRDLKPLLSYLSDGKLRPTKPAELECFLSNAFCKTEVRCLVVTLPDPVESLASSRFDAHLDVLQRAVELQGYVLDRSLLPWKKGADDSTAPPDRVTKLRAGEWAFGVTLETSNLSKERQIRPGLMVFRSAFPKKGEEPAILLAFLVPESPVLGIHKRALVRSLDLIHTYFREWLRPDAKGKRKVIHIIAPCFTSSHRSLEVALRGWKPDGPSRYHFRVISSGTAEVDRKLTDEIFAGPSPHGLTLHSMVHSAKILKNKMLEYLTDDQGYSPNTIAVLIESNTGLAQALVQRDRQANDSPVEFLFPLQVSEVRKAYEKAGLLRNGKIDDPAAPERLRIPPDEGGAPRDLPRSFTPATSAAHDEMALTQVLTTIARRPYRAVGIIATNPFDVVFLAREVRRFCPNVRLFTIASDLLLARPAEVIDLRGMLVASTYPLYPSNQWMTTPFRNAPRVFFSDRGAQGLYNATAAHLWEMKAEQPPPGDKPSSVPQLLEFALPYDLTPRKIRQPPVWISAVGERGLYPVKFIPVTEASDELYDPSKSPEPRAPTPWPPEDQHSIHDAAVAMMPHPHVLFWLLYLSLILACVLVASLTWLYITWSIDEKKCEREYKALGFLGLGHILRMLNCEVAEKDSKGKYRDPESKKPLTDRHFNPQERYRDQEKNPNPPPVGAGAYVLWMNLVVCAVAGYVFWHYLAATNPLSASGQWDWSWFKLIVIAVAIMAMVAIVAAAVMVAASPIFSLSAGIAKRPASESGPVERNRNNGAQKRRLPSSAHRILDHEVLRRWARFATSILVLLIVTVIVFCVATIATVTALMLKRSARLAAFVIACLLVIAFGYLTTVTACIAIVSTIFSLTECFLVRPESESTPNAQDVKLETRNSRLSSPRPRFLSYRQFKKRIGFAVFAGCSILAVVGCFANPYILPQFSTPTRRLTFDRLTNLPSGVSPIFPILFLSAAFAAWIYSSLAQRRLYRLSYLPSDVVAQEERKDSAQFTRILIDMRKTRGEVDHMIASWRANPLHDSPLIVCLLALLFIHIGIRTYFRGLPTSLEGTFFDVCFWGFFLLAFLLIIWRVLNLWALAKDPQDASSCRRSPSDARFRSNPYSIQGLVLRRGRFQGPGTDHPSADRRVAGAYVGYARPDLFQASNGLAPVRFARYDLGGKARRSTILAPGNPKGRRETPKPRPSGRKARSTRLERPTSF